MHLKSLLHPEGKHHTPLKLKAVPISLLMTTCTFLLRVSAETKNLGQLTVLENDQYPKMGGVQNVCKEDVLNSRTLRRFLSEE